LGAGTRRTWPVPASGDSNSPDNARLVAKAGMARAKLNI
jgi:hypothetical protein